MPTPEPATTNSRYFWTLNAVLGVVFICDLAAPKISSVLDPALIVLAAIACVAALHRRLPLQNVLPAVLIIAVIGGIAHGLSARTGFPFGPLAFNLPAGTEADLLNQKTEITLNPLANKNPGQLLLFHALPWTLPLLWIAAIYCARGVGRLILRPWRKVKNYGFRLIGLTALLAVTFDVAMEPYAAGVKHWWHWQHTKIPFTWQGATLVNFLGWACVSLLIMMFITPFLIRKQPGKHSAAEFHPLILWLGTLLLFAVGCARTALWSAVGADVAIATVTTVFAIRGAKW